MSEDAVPLSELIEKFRAEVWNGATAVTAIEVQDTCTAYSHEFREWLEEHGIPAAVRYFDSADDLGYLDRTLDAGGEGHAVVECAGVLIDWTAAQYGYREFPKVTAT